MSSLDFCDYGKCRKPSCTHHQAGYIVERLVDHNCANYCYRGLISISDFQDNICPPLYLKKIEVLDVKSIALSCSGEKLRLTLALQGIDSRSCCFRAMSYIELDTPPQGCACFDRHNMNVRRDIQIGIQSANYCQPSSFQVCLSIGIESIFSRYEIVCQQNECCMPKLNLPLYPPPMCSKGEHSGCCFK